MAGIGVIVKAVGRIGGRMLGRFAGPLGAIVTIGELGYLGLKYSGTLENFKKLYCDKCRSEIPFNHICAHSSQYDMGTLFEVACPHCRQKHSIAKIPLRCPGCRSTTRDENKERNVIVPVQAKFLFLTCPQCHRPIRLTKNKYYQKI